MFSSTGSVLPDTRKGKTKEKKIRSEDNIERVRQEISRDKTVSIRNISQALDLSYGTVHKILRDELNLYPYKSHLTNHLEPRHKRERREFCTWLLNKSEDFPTTVIWTDEKMFEERTRPNKQNERYWAVEDPEITDECRVVGG